MKKPRHRGQAFSLLTKKADDSFSWCSHYIHMTVVSNRSCCNNEQLLNSWNISEELFKLGKYKVRRPQRPSEKKIKASQRHRTPLPKHTASHTCITGDRAESQEEHFWGHYYSMNRMYIHVPIHYGVFCDALGGAALSPQYGPTVLLSSLFMERGGCSHTRYIHPSPTRFKIQNSVQEYWGQLCARYSVRC